MKTAIVLGTFDGLHAGHRAVLEAAKGFFCIAVTFSLPPKSIITGEPQLLMQPHERIERLKQLGVDQVELQDFESVKDIEAVDYLEWLNRKYAPHRIVCGFNYRFGKDVTGDADLLKKFCDKKGIEFICVSPVTKDGNVLSSTVIRNLIKKGNMSDAAPQIYGGFLFKAPVLHGDARGRELGFPTANQEYPNELVRLKFGVYISRVTIENKQYQAITNIGIRPTYKTETVGCETFIKDFSADIYGKEMTTELLHFVREEKKFHSVEELKNAILNDIKLLK